MKKSKLDLHKEYIEFLEKRLKSENFKNNVSKEEYDKTAQKLKKAKLLLKMGLIKWDIIWKKSYVEHLEETKEKE